MVNFSSEQRTTFFKNSGIPFYDAYSEKNGKKVLEPYMLYMVQKEPAEKIEELKKATTLVGDIFQRVARQMHSWDKETLLKWGFDERYAELLQIPWDDMFCMRIGWAWKNDKPQILETNSQTPSFWPELETANQKLVKHFGLKDPNPRSNDFLRASLNQAIEKKLAELPAEKRKTANVGFVTNNYWEDIDTMNWLASFCDYKPEVLHIDNFYFTDDFIPYNKETGTKLDVLIFWVYIEKLAFGSSPVGRNIWPEFIEGLRRQTFRIAHAIPAFFVQSKAMLAYITEHPEELFVGELKAAEQYFPKSYLTPEPLGDTYFSKPIWGREGRGSYMVKKGETLSSRNQESYYMDQRKVYQELLTIPQMEIENYPFYVIYEAWTYNVDNKFVPGGIGLRLSDHVITDDDCYFLAMGI